MITKFNLISRLYMSDNRHVFHGDPQSDKIKSGRNERWGQTAKDVGKTMFQFKSYIHHDKFI